LLQRVCPCHILGPAFIFLFILCFFLPSFIQMGHPSLVHTYPYKQMKLLAAQRSLQARRELLEEACLSHTRKRQVLSPEDLKHLIVDDKHNLIYCYVPKVACTNWKRVLMVLTSDGRLTSPLDIPANEAHVAGNLHTLSEFSVPEINHRLRSYLKFIFAREPFERLVSAYRNKFTRKVTSRWVTALFICYGYIFHPCPKRYVKSTDS
uniref:Carbohydrate sulfotransferase n=1 Tax=Mola mola TaxID=94237 RepID=A0A3Q3XC54_MOLML